MRLVSMPLAPSVAIRWLDVRTTKDPGFSLGSEVIAHQIDHVRPRLDTFVRERRQPRIREAGGFLDGIRTHQETGVGTIGPAGHRIRGIISPADDFKNTHAAPGTRFMAATIAQVVAGCRLAVGSSGHPVACGQLRNLLGSDKSAPASQGNGTMAKRSRVLAGLLVLVCGVAVAYCWPSKDQAEAPSTAALPASEVRDGDSLVPSALPKSPSPASIGRAPRQTDIATVLTPQQAYDAALVVTHCATLGSVEPPPDMTPEQAETFRQSSRGRYDCTKQERRFGVYDLAKYAADSGNVKAQADFSGLVAIMLQEEKAMLDPEFIARYKRDSLKYLQAAARSGNQDAHIRLAMNYEAGRFSPADPVMAYAHAYWYSIRSSSPAAEPFLAEFAKGLTPQQLAEGRRIASTMQ